MVQANVACACAYASFKLANNFAANRAEVLLITYESNLVGQKHSVLTFTFRIAVDV